MGDCVSFEKRQIMEQSRYDSKTLYLGFSETQKTKTQEKVVKHQLADITQEMVRNRYN